MKYRLFYTAKAKEDLSGMDLKTAGKILDKMDFYIDTGEPFKYAKKLSDFKNGTYRFRVGGYRVIFDTDNENSIIVLLVLRIKHRREVYL